MRGFGPIADWVWAAGNGREIVELARGSSRPGVAPGIWTCPGLLPSSPLPLKILCYLFAPSAFIRPGKAKMLTDPGVHNLWLRLLEKGRSTQTVQVQKFEEGYYAVVLASRPEACAAPCGESPDYQALESRIPNLSRTRAVCLNSGAAYHLPGVENLREWAGDLAAEVESGACHAFDVVDIDRFRERVSAELEAANWKVESHGQGLTVSDGRFTEQVNLLRGVGARSQKSGVRSGKSRSSGVGAGETEKPQTRRGESALHGHGAALTGWREHDTFGPLAASCSVSTTRASPNDFPCYPHLL